MAWDDAPPETASWDATPPAPGDLDPSKSLMGFLGNAASNAGRLLNPINLAKGAGDQVKQGAFDMPLEATNTLANTVAKAVGGEEDETAEKSPVEHLLQDPTMEGRAEDMAASEPVQHPVDYAYKNPVDTAMTLSAAALPFMGGSEAAAGARGTIAEDAGPAASAPKESPTYFHGTNQADQIRKAGFSLSNPEESPFVGDNIVEGVHLSPTKEPYIEGGQMEGVQDVLPVKTSATNILKTDAAGVKDLYKKFGISEMDEAASKKLTEALKSQGYEGLDLNGETVIFDPAKVSLHEGEGKPQLEAMGGGKGGKSATMEAAEDFAKNPPKQAAKESAPTAKDPLQDVKDYIKRNQAKIEAKPGWQEKAAKYVKNEVADLRAKDIGMRDPMIRSLDPKRPLEALKKAEDLMGYAGQQGYFKPGLTDVARKDAIAAKIAETGKGIGAVREIAGKRAAPPIDAIRNTIKNELTNEYGQKAGREIETVLSDFDRKVKADPSFQGLSDVATYLNGEKHTFNKIGQNPGPTTDAANIISRMNNEALRKVLSPEEDAFYTKNLRDFGAHKKLEQMVASAARRGMTGRGAPGGALSALWQQLWDRGGYRMAGNIADRMSTGVLKNPGKIKTVPQFFEDLAHHAGDEVDDTISGMSQGGLVPDDVKRYVSSKC